MLRERTRRTGGGTDAYTRRGHFREIGLSPGCSWIPHMWGPQTLQCRGGPTHQGESFEYAVLSNCETQQKQGLPSATCWVLWMYDFLATRAGRGGLCSVANDMRPRGLPVRFPPLVSGLLVLAILGSSFVAQDRRSLGTRGHMSLTGRIS